MKLLQAQRKKRFADDDSLNQLEKAMQNDDSVKWIERQQVKKRSKRDYIEEPKIINKIRSGRTWRQADTGIDPQWESSWYLNRNLKNPQLPDMNVTGAWSQGVSGKGISVTFLDDGLEHDHPDLHINYVNVFIRK